MSEPLKKADPQIVKELAVEAEGLRTNRAFVVATQILQKQWYGELLDPKTDDERARIIRAQLVVLEAIPRMLDHLVDNQKLAVKRA